MAVGSFAAGADDVGTGSTSNADLEEKLFKKREQLNKILQNKNAKEQQKLEADFVKYSQKLRDEAAKKEAEERKKLEDEINQHSIANLNAKAENLANKVKKIGGDIAPGLVEGVSKGIKAIGGSVKEYLSIYTNYMASINARIQGAGSNFNFTTINDILSRNTSFNPFIKYTDTISHLNKLVELGIADNLVQRTFLDTIAENIAKTFDAAESSLLKIVRIQQRDSTAARLGMESELTQVFNYYFSDTSYLNTTFDSVQDALIDLSAQLDDRTAVEFEYIVQKWLGSLGSVGVSENVLTNIAQGISYLGTGNVNALSGNQQLQNLLVMASNRAGLDYSGMLTEGINTSQVNALLASVIQYIQEIASSNNNVVKQQYAQLFGLSIADMRAFQNINDEVLSSLIKNGMTYSDTLNELNNQIGQLGSRLHLSTMIDNVLNNAMAATSAGVLNSPAAYGIWKAADMLESLTGGIQLPFISALGSGLDLNMSLEGLIKGGVVGIGAIGALVSGIENIANGGGMGSFNTASGINSWWNVGLNKGTGFSGYQNTGRLSTTASSTAYVSSGNELGIQQSLSDTQKQTGEQVQGEDQTANDTMQILQALDKNLEALYNYFEGGGDVTKPLIVRVEGNNPFNLSGTSGLYGI